MQYKLLHTNTFFRSRQAAWVVIESLWSSVPHAAQPPSFYATLLSPRCPLA